MFPSIANGTYTSSALPYRPFSSLLSGDERLEMPVAIEPPRALARPADFSGGVTFPRLLGRSE